MGRGVDFVAGFGADAAVLVVAVGEGDACDLRGGDGMGGVGCGLRGALVGGGVGGDAVVEECSAKGGERVGVEADGGYGAHLSVVGGVAGVEVEGADVTVFAGEIPCGRDGEGDAVAGVVEGTRGRGVRLGGWFRGFALEEWGTGSGWPEMGLDGDCARTGRAVSRARTVQERLLGRFILFVVSSLTLFFAEWASRHACAGSLQCRRCR